MKQRNRFLIILGPHRSGTSLVANALHTMGVNLGTRFIEQNRDNPKGFFEDEAVVRFNDRLLSSMSLSWDSFGFIWKEDFSAKRFKPYHDTAVAMIRDRFAECSVAGLKDPRFCLLLPFWKRVISEALDADVMYVLGIRAPNDCVRSQRTRYINDSDFHLLGRRNIQSLLLWWTYLTRVLTEVAPEHLVVVNYTSLAESPESELHRLAGLLELELSQSACDSFCRLHVDADLNRSSSLGEVDRRESPLLWSYADTLHERLLLLAGRDAPLADGMPKILNGLDINELEPLYLRELSLMYGYSYSKVLNIRHRLIRTIQELGEAKAEHNVLLEELGKEQTEHYALLQAHEALIARHKAVLNTRGWRCLARIRRYTKWLFR
tara:strand:- start:13667 stop:14800 length:1134 start_codon:yes stop_codon:yes gene_type:complete